jgi:hypothetical protein
MTFILSAGCGGLLRITNEQVKEIFQKVVEIFSETLMLNGYADFPIFLAIAYLVDRL